MANSTTDQYLAAVLACMDARLDVEDVLGLPYFLISAS